MNFFTSWVCCGKRNKNGELQFGGHQQMQNINHIDQRKVIFYINDFEARLTSDLDRVPLNEFIKEAKLLASYDGSISARQLSIVYSKFDLPFTDLVTIFSQEFFFKNQIGLSTEYDTVKMCLFNMLYCDADEKTKLAILYELVVGHEQ